MEVATVHKPAAVMAKDGQVDDLQHPHLRYFRHRLFTVYRRLFTIVSAANLIGLIWVCSQDTSPTASNSALLSGPIAANLFVAVLFRTDDFINFLYTSVVWVPLSLPLSIRRHIAKIYEFGGVHSGTSVAATLWTIFFAVQITRSFKSDPRVTVSILATTWLILAMLLSVVIMAHPAIRVKYHNAFEQVHRFSGWTAIILYWVLHFLLTASLARDSTTATLGQVLFTSPTTYFVVAITLLLILPWARLRRVQVHATRTSNHATRLYFESLKAQPTQTIRISTSPLLEWHSFAIIPHGAPYTSSDSFPETTAESSPRSLPTPVKTTSSSNSSTITLTDSLHKKANATVTVTETNAPLSHPHQPLPSPSSSPFSILISAAGDWTTRTIASPSPTRTLWFRGKPTTGVTQAALLFRSAVIVTTGSGIGPALSLLMLLKARGRSAHPPPQNIDGGNSEETDASDLEKGYDRNGSRNRERERGNYRLIWSTPSPLATYGPRLLDKIHDADPDALVWDTRAQGRPDLTALAWGMYKGGRNGERSEERDEIVDKEVKENEEGLRGKGTGKGSEYEAVFVVSNQKVTEDVVFALEARGVPAFGPIFDS